MKRITVLILISILFFSTGGGTVNAASSDVEQITDFREIPGVTEDEISAIESLKAKNKEFFYAHLTEKEAFLRPDGSYAGFTPELLELLSELFGVSFTGKPYRNIQELNSDLDALAADFTGELTPTVKRQRRLYMTSPIAERMQTLYTPADSKKILHENDINGMRVGFLENSDNMYIVAQKYPDISLKAVMVEDISLVERMLVSGEIDAFVTERAFDFLFEGNEKIQTRTFFQRAYVPVSLATANKELEPFISVFNKYLEAGGIDKLHQMYIESEHDYIEQVLANSFTDEEREYIDLLTSTGAEVSVALEYDHYPVSFYNQNEGEFEGIAKDVLDEVSSLTGIKFKNVTKDGTPWIEILNMLKSGETSLVSELGYSKEREGFFVWCEVPYFQSNFAYISKESLENIKSYQIPRARVGTITGSYYEDMYRHWFPDSKNLLLYQNQNDALEALEKDEIDLVLGAEYILLTQANYREKPGYKLNYLVEGGISCTFGLNKNEGILRSILDKAQRHIDVDAISGHWRNRVFNYSEAISRIRTAYLSVFLVILLAALLQMIYFSIKNRRLSNRLAERTMMLSAIYASLPDTLFCKNNEGRYTSCNPSFEKQAGMPEAEIVGKTYAEVFGARVTETVGFQANIDSNVISGGSVEILNETVTYPDGSRKNLELLKAPLIQDGAVVGVLGIGRDITERLEITNRFEFILNTAQIAYILTINDIVTEVNEYGRNILGIMPGDDIKGFYADISQRDYMIRLAKRDGAASNAAVKFKMANGEVHRFVSSFAVIEYNQKKAYVHWAIDIEQDEKKNDKMRIMQQSLQMVLDALPVPVLVYGMEISKIVYVNDSFLELFEYDSADEICGRDIPALLPGKTEGEVSETNIADFIEGIDKPLSIEMEYKTKSGKIREAFVDTRIIDYRGRRSAIGIIKDLTAEKERARVLIEAADREREANQAKSLFLANMSHEIRTPMNGILGMADLMMGEELSVRQHQYVKDIKTSAGSLLNIINDILDFSKITEGRLQIVPVDVELCSMLKNIVSMMSFAASSKGLDFVDDICINSPEYVRADDTRLKQVIVNLLSNAIKFTEKGSVKLTAKIEDGLIQFEVKDTGIGIKKDELPLIFRAFEQVDKQKNRTIKGTGLGLSISKNLVELMEGRIWVDSEYGLGTTFYVTIPYVEGNEVAVETVDTKFKYLFAPTAQILVVDDIQTNLTVAAGLLRLCGITADVAMSGKEAVELVKNKDYDLVLMDHMMPGMDGIEAMKLIKGMGDKYQKLPVIALTANAVNESKALLISSGMDDFLSKPIDKAELMLILQKWLPEGKIVSIADAAIEETDESLTGILSAASLIDGLDVGLALSRISGLQSVLEDSIEQMAFSIEQRLKNMDMFLLSGDLKGFTIEAHGFKGALANIGATRNSELAAELEIAGKAENRQVCSEKFSGFEDVLNSFANQLKSVFSEDSLQSSDENRTPGDTGILAEKVAEAIENLNKFEAELALMCLDELKQFTFGEEADAVLSDAISLIKAYKYKKAVPQLENLRALK